MKIPKTFVNNNRKYYFVELYKNFARYQTRKGICECFVFHDLGLIEETERQYSNINPEKVVI